MTTINSNIGALGAQASMARANEAMSTAMNRLSSGLRINSAKDDAAGMAIADKMTAQIMGMGQAIRNATDGKNLIDTTESAHGEVSNMLQRVRELAVQSSNDTNTGSDRGNIVAEARQLLAEINRVAQNTTFNGMKVMDGSFQGRSFQIGADAGQSLSISIDSAAATDIGANTLRSNVATAATGGVTAGAQLAISGRAGSATIEVEANMSAKDLASAVNAASPQTGVEATATTKAKLSGLTQTGLISFEINGTSVGEVAIANTGDLRALRDAINAKSTTTGVSAAMGANNGEILLTDATGKNIDITDFTSANSGVAAQAEMFVTGLNADGTEADVAGNTDRVTVTNAAATASVTGQVAFTSTKNFTVNSTALGGSDVGFFTATANRSTLESVASIDLSNAESAAKAIGILDSALQQIASSRGAMGAVSNRLDSTISNLTNITTSVQAAKSQIMDADFAAESTALARGQILAQASTAMLAQANASKQNMLSLLR